MDSRPVGIFDSGVGGLTAVRSLRALLPAEDIVFLADTARVPYGGRSAAELRGIAAGDTRFLNALGAKAVLAACGTVSSNCPETVLALAAGPACGVVAAAAREAVRVSRGGRIGVVATEATARAGAFEREILALAPGARVITQGTAELVPLVEAGRTDVNDAAVRGAVRRAAEPFRGEADTLILGCTHFPLLAEAFRLELPEAELVDSGAAGAKAMAELLRERGLLAPEGRRGGAEFFVSGSREGFARAAALFLPGGIDPARVHGADLTQK